MECENQLIIAHSDIYYKIGTHFEVIYIDNFQENFHKKTLKGGNFVTEITFFRNSIVYYIQECHILRRQLARNVAHMCMYLCILYLVL